MNSEIFMRRALSLALKGSGKVSPNPRVGAVIIKDNQIKSEGYHRFYGGRHAEVDAIENAQITDFSDCTIVVNLEPCSHYGKTPPCAELLIEKKFKKVIIGMEDPNPLVSGKGINLLMNAGIEVETGILEEDCKWINRFFIKNITKNQIYILMKVAQSLNGAISTFKSESKWITCEESRKRTHALRAQSDAVLIGKTTAIKDNPELNVRMVKGVNPKRIILDTNLSIPLDLKILKDSDRKNTIILCKKEAERNHKFQVLKQSGVKIAFCETNESGKIDIHNAIMILKNDFSINSLLIEGGASIFSDFIKENLVDELHVFQAPMIIGQGINAFSALSTDLLKDSRRFSLKYLNKSGNDIYSVLLKEEQV